MGLKFHKLLVLGAESAARKSWKERYGVVLLYLSYDLTGCSILYELIVMFLSSRYVYSQSLKARVTRVWCGTTQDVSLERLPLLNWKVCLGGEAYQTQIKKLFFPWWRKISQQPKLVRVLRCSVMNWVLSYSTVAWCVSVNFFWHNKFKSRHKKEKWFWWQREVETS